MPVPDFLYGTAWKEDRTQVLTELALRTGFRGIDTANQRRHYFEAGGGPEAAAAHRAGVRPPGVLFLETEIAQPVGHVHPHTHRPTARIPTPRLPSLAAT